MMNTHNKEKVLEEVFVSPFVKTNKADALVVLAEIRKTHSQEFGWVELIGYVEELSPGEFTAVRHHVQYR